MDVEADVAGHGAERLAAVDAHPDADIGAARPRVLAERPLRLDRGRHGAADGGEREEQPVPGGIDPLAVVCLGRRADDPVVVGEERGVGVAELLQEPGRALDVGEQERDGAARQRDGHHQRPSSRTSRRSTRPATVRR